MASDTFAIVLFVLSAINLAAAIAFMIASRRETTKNFAAINSNEKPNVYATCNHCHHIVARYFIDGAGKTTCANCKPEGFSAAVQNKTLNESD